MYKKEFTLVSFNEDDFDFDACKKAADTRTHLRVKRARRQVAFGKIMLAIVSLVVVFLLYYVITVLITRQNQAGASLHFEEYWEDHRVALGALPDEFF